MTREDIIRMAREAELIRDDSTASRWLAGTDLYPELNAFAALVATAEQDRCCKIVYGMAGSDNVAQRTVDAIRRKA